MVDDAPGEPVQPSEPAREPVRKTILVVDDDHRNRELLTFTLQGEFRVLTAGDGAAGFAAAREHRPDLILMDVDMPRLTGLEACRRLKADPLTHTIPIFLVTGRDTDAVRDGWPPAGADAYLTKPYSPVALLARVRSWLAASGC